MSEGVLITDIQHFMVNDGPGFRTGVFIKGCNMKCAWCHNPETQAPYHEIYWRALLCVQCGACLTACPENAINPPIPPEEARSEGSTYHKIIRERCTRCMKCIDACKYNALNIVGQEYSIDEVLEEVQKDEPFYVNSGGGMTISGGEPLTSPEFIQELLARAKAKGLHTCLDTSGLCPWEVLGPILKNVDIVLYDLKHINSAEHKRMTGVGNELILSNLKKISENGQAIWVRIPVIPDYNDQLDYHLQVVDFLKSLPKPVERVDLLPFHNWCQDKYRWLGKDWVYTGMEAIEPSFLNPILDIYRDAGIPATIGGSGFEGRE